MVKKSLLRYALAPWGMQPNTSLWRFLLAYAWADFHSCLCTAYYTIFEVPGASPRHFHHAPTINSITPFQQPRHTIQTHSSPPPPILTGNQIAACFFRGWCAPSGVLVRTICCSAAHQRKFCCAPFSNTFLSDHGYICSTWLKRYALAPWGMQPNTSLTPISDVLAIIASKHSIPYFLLAC